jgi:hypothetical protein
MKLTNTARLLYLVANILAAVVLVLLLLDPTRPLPPVFVILGLSVVCWLAPIFLNR